MIVALLFSLLASIRHLVFEWGGAAEDSASSIRPNILLIVADDLGYNDTSAINPEGLSTPNITALARRGVTFTRHYADSTCTPSRVGIMTGRYPERSGFRPIGAEIPAEYPTIAERLKEAGYHTYLTGKWHAGEDRRSGWPEQKGFDGWFGFLNQFETADERAVPPGRARTPTYHNPMLRHDGNAPTRHEGHLTDLLTEHTVDRIRQLQAQGEPWFIYHAFLAPHAPIQPAARYKQRFPDTPEGAYTALVNQLDDAVGRILEVVDSDNTLVIFVSDNGGTNAQRDNNFPFFGRKNEVFEGAYRTPLILHWPGVIPEDTRVDDLVMNVDVHPTILAAAKVPPTQGIDGHDLWSTLLAEAAVAPRARGWETFSENVNSISFSYLSADGGWRLVSEDGIGRGLYDLVGNPAGDADVARQHPAAVNHLVTEYWQDHFAKSLVPVRQHIGEHQQQTTYTGFDALRTPFRYGFAIGLEIGPLPQGIGGGASPDILAQQEGHWTLQYSEGHGLEWHVVGTALRDASFEPSLCNRIVLTGYLQPLAHLAVRAPRSTLKLYASGFLQDIKQDLAAAPLPEGDELHSPTVVNHGGRALFSNMMLSSFADPYSPQVREEFMGFYIDSYREKSLALADVSMLDSELCRGKQPDAK